MDPKDIYSPEPYSETMKYATKKLEMEAFAIKSRGYGGMVNIFSSSEDQTEQKHLLEVFRNDLGVEATDVVHIDIEQVVNALELGIKRYQLGIPTDDFEHQSLPENVFQFAYRSFGTDRKGWRMGPFAMIDEIKELMEQEHTNLENTPFADFLATLNLELENKTNAPKMIILHYPILDIEKPIKSASDSELENQTPPTAQRVEKFMHIYSLISQVYPSKFQHDNPQGNVIVNVLDDSYRWFAARNLRWTNAYDKMTDRVETPNAHFRDQQILNTA